MLKRLRRKFVAIMMTIVTVMLFVIFLLILHFTHLDYINNSTQQMRSIAMQPFVPNRPDAHRDTAPFPHFVLTVNKNGELLDVSGKEYFDLSDEDFLLKLVERVSASSRPDGLIIEYQLRYLSVTDASGQMRVVFMDAAPEFSAVEKMVKLLFPIGIAALAVFWRISISLANITIKPVEQAWEQQRQFVANASHELKTPLTVITTNAELLASSGYSEAEKKRFGDNILTMAKQMRSLVEQLLELARVDNGTLQMSMEIFDLSEMISSALLPFEPLCFESSLSLESSIESGIYTKGSCEHLRQVLEVLLDNALKYSFAGSTVRVRLERQGLFCLLSVANSGPSMSAGELENIFKRFYRVDKARSRNGSYGLGLAIAGNIVKLHSGKIWAESSNGVNTFRVRLPI